MKTTGYIRRLDSFGRLNIPKRIADKMRVQDGDAFEIFTAPNEIIFRKYAPNCAFCGGEVGFEGGVEFKSCAVCGTCAHEFMDVVKAGA